MDRGNSFLDKEKEPTRYWQKNGVIDGRIRGLDLRTDGRTKRGTDGKRDGQWEKGDL